MSEKSLSKSIFSYSSAILYCRLASVVQGLVVIRLMDPGMLGVWLELQLITIYGALAHLGLFNAVNRQVPFHRGRGEEEQALHVERVVRAFVFGLFVLGVVAVAATYLTGLAATERGLGILTVVSVAIATLGINFYLGLFRARHKFGRAGLASVVNATVVLLGLPLVYYLGFEGLLLRALLAATAGLLACLALSGWDLSVEFDWKELSRLLRLGLPIMIVGFGTVTFTALDRTLIAFLLDDFAMGQYAMCFALAKVLALFPVSIGQVYYPRMTEIYSSEGISARLVNLCIQASAISGVIVGVLSLGAYLTMPWVVESYFPKYAPGLPALRVALISYFLLALASGPTYFVISTVQKRRQLVLLTIGIALTVGLAYALVDRGLVGIAWSRALGTVVYVVGLWIIVVASRRAVRNR